MRRATCIAAVIVRGAVYGVVGFLLGQLLYMTGQSVASEPISVTAPKPIASCSDDSIAIEEPTFPDLPENAVGYLKDVTSWSIDDRPLELTMTVQPSNDPTVVVLNEGESWDYTVEEVCGTDGNPDDEVRDETETTSSEDAVLPNTGAGDLVSGLAVGVGLVLIGLGLIGVSRHYRNAQED